MIARSRIDLGPFEAFLFDLDGVVTRTARVHAAAWKRLFDDYDYLARRASAEGTAFVPFDAVEDYGSTSTASRGRPAPESSWAPAGSRFRPEVRTTDRRRTR